MTAPKKSTRCMGGGGATNRKNAPAAKGPMGKNMTDMMPSGMKHMPYSPQPLAKKKGK